MSQTLSQAAAHLLWQMCRSVREIASCMQVWRSVVGGDAGHVIDVENCIATVT
jgi:hypothetical protein